MIRAPGLRLNARGGMRAVHRRVLLRAGSLPGQRAGERSPLTLPTASSPRTVGSAWRFVGWRLRAATRRGFGSGVDGVNWGIPVSQGDMEDLCSPLQPVPHRL
jgi:hypothetical protein